MESRSFARTANAFNADNLKPTFLPKRKASTERTAKPDLETIKTQRTHLIEAGLINETIQVLKAGHIKRRFLKL